MDDRKLHKAADFRVAAIPLFEAAGYLVQTTRLATVPFPQWSPSLSVDRLIGVAQSLESAAESAGYRYVSLGPALPDQPESYQGIPEMLAATKNIFLSGMLTIPGGVSLPAVSACAEVISRTAALAPTGFTNMRFCALANVPPGAPFFPAAYHDGGGAAFALATEAADLVVEAFGVADSLEDARQRLIDVMERHATALSGVALNLAQQFGLSFAGIDFTPAPFPEHASSLGTALERLGVPAVGQHGSLAASAILADTLDRARFLRAGFNGLILPVLEDSVLASRAAEGSLSVKDLLLYSAVCGTGLDTIPLPGDTTAGQLQAILLDVAALAQRLDKPLTARLMPIPGRSAGDPTGLEDDRLAAGRVMAVEAAPLEGFLAGKETFLLKHRPKT